MPREHPQHADLSGFPPLIVAALVAELVGMVTTLPCLIDTTPFTMGLFFALSLPLLTVGGAAYAIAVIRDLRRHKVL